MLTLLLVLAVMSVHFIYGVPSQIKPPVCPRYSNS